MQAVKTGMDHVLVNVLKLLLCILIGFVGANIFSFLALIISRKRIGRDELFGRSRCNICKKELKMYDMVPIISAIFLKMRCRFCGYRYPYRDFLFELLGFALFFVLALKFFYE